MATRKIVTRDTIRKLATRFATCFAMTIVHMSKL
jgi:hypothetical protein